MKRDHRDACPDSAPPAEAKASLWEDDNDPSASSPGSMDELLIILGYKIRSSDMADVALKLEQLEMVLYNNSIPSLNGDVNGSALTNDTAASYSLDNVFSYISHLSSDAVHHPFDLSSWLLSVLSELNPAPDFSAAVAPPSHHQQQPPPPKSPI